MADQLISNAYVGDGTTFLYSFTFPYIKIADVLVQLDGVPTTEYSFANATTIQLNTAPADGVDIVIYRSTDNSDLRAVFFPGSAIRARDLNDNFTQSLYVVQEATFTSTEANASATASKLAAEEAKAAAVIAQTEASNAAAGVASAEDSANSALIAAQAAQASANKVETDTEGFAEDVAQAAADAAQASADAAAAQQAAQEAADAVSEGPVVSVNGKQGLVVLDLTDLSDVDTSSAGHIPADGQALVWNESMGHWMPSDASLIIGSLPTLP